MYHILSCQHYDVMDDYENGCSVCVKCGLVIEEQLYQCYNKPSQTISSSEDLTYFPKTHFEGLMWEVYEKHNLPKTIYFEILHSFEETSNINTNVMQFACQTYNKLLLQNVPRTKNETCDIFNISLKDFNDTERILFQNTTNIDTLKPSALIPRLTSLKLSYANQVSLGEQADLLYKKVNASPNVVMAYILYTEGNNRNLFQHLPRKILSINYSSRLCKTSSTSIRRLIKKLK